MKWRAIDYEERPFLFKLSCACCQTESDPSIYKIPCKCQYQYVKHVGDSQVRRTSLQKLHKGGSRTLGDKLILKLQQNFASLL